MLQERPDVRKFKGGNPEYLDMLIELFQGVAVDGSSAYVPIDEDEEEDDVADDGNEESPMSTTSRKRGSSYGEQSASSPGKKHKSPMVKLMTGLINSINSDNTCEMIAEYANKRQEAKDKAKENKSTTLRNPLLIVKCWQLNVVQKKQVLSTSWQLNCLQMRQTESYLRTFQVMTLD